MSDNKPASDLSVIETAAIRETLDAFEGEVDAVVQLIELFIEDTGQQLQQLTSAAHSGDLESVEHIAHTIKSSCAFVGATTLSSHLAETEVRNRLGNLTIQDSQQIVGQVVEEFNRVICSLQHHIDTGLSQL